MWSQLRVERIQQIAVVQVALIEELGVTSRRISVLDQELTNGQLAIEAGSVNFELTVVDFLAVLGFTLSDLHFRVECSGQVSDC